MKKLFVKKFRQITAATVEVHDITVLIGEQASGKSTIAKLIHFFMSLKQDYLDIVSHTSSANPADVQTALLGVIRDKFAAYFGFASKYDEDFEIVFYYSDIDDLSVRLFKAKSLQVSFSEALWALVYDNAKEAILKRTFVREQKFTSFLMQDKAERTFRQYLVDNASEVFADKRDSLFIPAGRNVSVSYPEQFQLLFFGGIGYTAGAKPIEVNTIDATLMKDFFSYSKFLVDYYSDKNHVLTGDSPIRLFATKRIDEILHGKYKNLAGNERMLYDGKNYVPLNLASSGQQESIRIIQDLTYILKEKDTTARIIEEPETHLFPSAQAALVQLLVLVSNYTHSQFVITTHSPFILTAINNLLYYHKVLQEKHDFIADIKSKFGTSKLDESKDESIAIRPENFQAYALKTGEGDYCKSIFDNEVGMISENYIDEASEAMYADFEYLYSKI